jgi:hypothetical protein
VDPLPFWLLNPGTGRAAACASLDAGPDARRVAVAKAQAELVRQRQVQVASRLEITSDASRLNGRAGARTDVQERVELSSAGLVENMVVLQAATVDWQGRRQLCVRVGPDALSDKEESNEKK